VLFHLAEPAALLGIALAFVIGVYAHDAAQVLVSWALGDPWAKRAGKLSLKPAAHVGPFSAVSVVIVGVGWTERVPMNDRWRARRWHVAFSVLAGPLAYILLAVAALAGFRGLAHRATVNFGDRTVDVVTSLPFGADMLGWMAVTFASMCVLSLVPLPPMDGGRILFTLAPTSPGWAKARYNLEERNWGLGIIMALLLLPVLFQGFPSVVGQLVPPLIRGLARLVGLDFS
jgi:Zn-dependent protease